MAAQRVSLSIKSSTLPLTETPSAPHDDHVGRPNLSGMPLMYNENDAHKIYRGLNGSNDFKHREVYKILARELRWANLRDDGLNHAVSIPRNIAKKTLDNSSPGNSVGSNNLSEDPDDPTYNSFCGPKF
ncbi:hypothetical protein GIB67_022443 [Kingdonia uniflora]|uniref:Uncharacterized protein n=1 Tax=Kingdonia uniflora TaxID=39325 RepID=A0A7J7MU09_9MAGN|nr:hypothetical protein GIB67_022443 [Kingdonia uniflora]